MTSNRISDIIEEMEYRLRDISEPVIALDGRCAAGKTTLANGIVKKLGFGVVHMDDYFLPADMRTFERLSQPGGNVHSERFSVQVLPFLKSSFSYRPYCCSTDMYGEPVSIPAGGVVVEGAYSLHPTFGSYYDLAVFMDISPELQIARIIQRSGEEKLPAFRDRWIPLEEAYHHAFDVKSRCDIVVFAEEITQ